MQNSTGASVAVVGTVALVDDGLRRPVTSPRAQALLVSLALARGRTVSVSSLVDDLWPQDRPQDPRAALQTVVSRLRSAAGPGTEIIALDAHGYGLVVPSDLDHLRACCTKARALLAEDAAHEAVDVLRECHELLDTAEPVPAEDESGLITSLRNAVDDLRAGVEQSLTEALFASGEDLGAIALAERRAADRPTDEALHLLLMEAYGRLGRTNDALRVFSRVRDAVAEELGTSPGPALVASNARMLAAAAQAEAAALPARVVAAGPAAAPEPPSTSPTQSARRSIGLRSAPDRLVGRDDDLLLLHEALDRSRLVTVLGPGGLGKTRLAQEIGRICAQEGRRVIVVELASIRTDDDVELALASTLSIREDSPGQRIGDRAVVRPDVLTRIADRLAEAPTLLVLDNCEHVVTGAATWSAELLAAVPGLSILTTSRSPLAIGGELLHTLAPLGRTTGGTPGAAAELFGLRARAVRPDVMLPAEVVDRLCAHLDGLPLAIELAAVRVRTMSVEEIEDRLSARFELLTAGDRSAPARHQTLQAVIDWSWNLLTTQEQAVLRRTSVFPAGFSAVAAQIVGTLDIGNGRYEGKASFSTLDSLDGLVNQSLLAVSQDPVTGAVRFRMLETVREFGDLRLLAAGERDAAREAFFSWALGHSTRGWSRLLGKEQIEATTDARLEQENLLHALRWSLTEGHHAVAASVFAHLGLFWTLRGAHHEASVMAAEIVEALRDWDVADDDASTAVIAFLLVLPSTFMAPSKPSRRALSRLSRLVRRPELLAPDALALAELVIDARTVDRIGPALERRRGSSTGLVGFGVHLMSAQLAENDGDLDLASRYARTSYTMATESHNTWGAATAAMLLGQLASEQARPEEALRWIALAEDGLVRVQADVDLAQLRWMETTNLAALGRFDEAEAVFTTLLDGVSEPRTGTDDEGDEMTAISFTGRAEMAAMRGDHTEALSCYEAAEDQFRSSLLRSSPWYTLLLGGFLAVASLEGDPRSGRLAPQLRARILADYRLRPQHTDFPVLGTCLVALGTYLAQTPALGRADDGLLLFHAARTMGARQDIHSMRLATHLDAARRVHGPERVDETSVAVEGLGREEVVALVLTILRRGRWQV